MKKTKVFCVGFLVLAFACSCESSAERTPGDPEFAGTTPVHVRVTWIGNPQTEAIVSWSTVSAGTSHRVMYDVRSRAGGKDAYTTTTDAGMNGRYSWEFPPDDYFARHSRAKPEFFKQFFVPVELYYHHAFLKGLDPSTNYYFRVRSGDRLSDEFYFRTAPADDRAFKLLCGGDSRTGRWPPDNENRRKINGALSGSASADSEILALVHGGDYVHRGWNLHMWSLWMTDHELTTTKDGRIIPIIPGFGNHEEGGEIYNQVFASPGGKERNYFSTRLSSEFVLLSLDTETESGGAQRKWLEKALESVRDSRWIVVQYHRPIYPAAKPPGKNKRDWVADLKKNWVPLFEKYHIDLAMESDGHCIKRTLPIREDKPDPTGIVYVGEGGLGAPQRTPKKGLWYTREPGKADRGHHFYILSVAKEKLGVKIVRLGGKVFDEFELKPRKH